MLAHVVAVAPAFDHLVQLLVAHDLAPFLHQGGQYALRREGQVDALAAPGGAALPQRVQAQLIAGGLALGAALGARRTQDVEKGLHKLGLFEGRLLQVVPGVQRLHDAAVDGRGHGRDHQHGRALVQLVDGVDDGHPGVALAPELDVEHHQVVPLAGQGGFGAVAVEPLVHLQGRAGSQDPAGELVAGGAVVFDDRDGVHGRHYRSPGQPGL